MSTSTVPGTSTTLAPPAGDAPSTRRRGRTVAAGAVTALAGGLFALVPAGSASAAGVCEEYSGRTYSVTASTWAGYDSLRVLPSTGETTLTITTAATRSSTWSVGGSVSASAGVIFGELSATVSGEYQETVTQEVGTSVSLTAPPSSATQEMRYGIIRDTVAIEESYQTPGCARGTRYGTAFVPHLATQVLPV